VNALRLLAPAVLLAVAACADPGGTGSAQPGDGDADANTAHGVAVDGVPEDKPTVEVPVSEPPAFVVEDLAVGDGVEAPPGAVVTVHYVGVAWSTRSQFDASWDRGQPATLPLDGVIGGWQQGIPGMREGGRRLLIIPPELAYGDTPPPGSGIAPGDTLVFVVDLLDVE
jgi:peptidylprolyl isomerase